MKRTMVIAGILVLAACGGAADVVTPPPIKPKPDPWLTIRVRDQLDTTTAPGQAHWHIYALLTGPYTALNGITFQGAISWADIRLHHDVLCGGAGADSVGQRLITMLALGDTTNKGLSADATAQSIADAWYGGNHTLPSGWMALTFMPQDAWQSAQYIAGHGLTRDDPIRWGFDWTGAGTTSFYERTDSDPTCSTDF